MTGHLPQKQQTDLKTVFGNGECSSVTAKICKIEDVSKPVRKKGLKGAQQHEKVEDECSVERSHICGQVVVK